MLKFCIGFGPESCKAPPYIQDRILHIFSYNLTITLLTCGSFSCTVGDEIGMEEVGQLDVSLDFLDVSSLDQKIGRVLKIEPSIFDNDIKMGQV